MSLLVCDDVADTADVLAAVYRPRGIAVRRIRPRDTPSSRPPVDRAVWIINEERPDPGEPPRGVLFGHFVDRAAATRSFPMAANAGVHCLPSLFDFGDLIAALDRMLEPDGAQLAAG